MKGKQKFVVNGLGNIQFSIEEGKYGKDDDLYLEGIQSELESLFFEAEDYEEDEE